MRSRSRSSALAREADDRAVDAEIGEVRERPLQRDQFTRAFR